jgi:hypothetical protein
MHEYVKADITATKITPDAFLSRWKERGDRDNSPVIPASEVVFRRFEAMAKEMVNSQQPAVLGLRYSGLRGKIYGRR